MNLNFSSSYDTISPSLIVGDSYNTEEFKHIPSKLVEGSFIPNVNHVELFIYDAHFNLIDSNYDFKNWKILENSNTSSNFSSNGISLDPIQDTLNTGYIKDSAFLIYNFINYELNSSYSKKYFISEISPDRRELRISSNYVNNDSIEKSLEKLKSNLYEGDYFKGFYLGFLGNESFFGINILLDKSKDKYSLLVKLSSPLPEKYKVNSECYIFTKLGESQAFKTSIKIDSKSMLEDVTYLRGPNFNLELNDFINNSSDLLSKKDLLNSHSTQSRHHLSNALEQKGIKITPNYSYNTFDEFIHFSSAKSRIINFIEKLSQIQSYEDDINTLKNISGSSQTSISINRLNSNIEQIIKNFDDYEYYLYYNTSSLSYPKVGSSFPYDLLPVDDPIVLDWLGSDDENSPYYGGILLSGSLYDENNPNWLYYTIPDFIKENEDNAPYIDFCNMVGQHFDYIWLYTKHITDISNTTNVLDKGVPMKLAENVISSLGYEGLNNNYNNQDNYIGLIGEDNRSYVPPTGSELITNYIAVNKGDIINYWDIDYSDINYVERQISPGFPYAIDKVSKEIFKRLYHNMSYLIKKKGTVSGLRQLINIWGIPNTILRINEFGGKDKLEGSKVEDYDFSYNRFSYEYTTTAKTQHTASSVIRIPWFPLNRNYIEEKEMIMPDALSFRFKTTGFPSSSFSGEYFTQSLLTNKVDGDPDSLLANFSIMLLYTGSLTGSYSGSNNDEYRDYGILRLFMNTSGSAQPYVTSSDIYLPFFNKDWWSVCLTRNLHGNGNDSNRLMEYTLYVKNKPHNGVYSNKNLFEGSASINSSGSSYINKAWDFYPPLVQNSQNSLAPNPQNGLFLGGNKSGFSNPIDKDDIIIPPNKIFSGSFQEFRLYSKPITKELFDTYVMNPTSIEGYASVGEGSSYDLVSYRLPLGNELESMFISSQTSSYSSSLTPIHPSTNDLDAFVLSSSLSYNESHILYFDNNRNRVYSKPNTETYFFSQPSMGGRNRITNKIHVEDSTNYGKVLSNKISIHQDYEISESYTPPTNYLEVSFSPQDEINDEIINSFGFKTLSNVLGDPISYHSKLDYYPELRDISKKYFEKYSKGNLYDYLRLIKYFDNSLFKAIKNYVPLRTNLSTGIVIKPHLLERNKYVLQKPKLRTEVAKSPSSSFNTPIIQENIEVLGEISYGGITGSTGGSLNKYNHPSNPNFNQAPFTQSWENNVITPIGETTIVEDTQKEFYNGEFSGSYLEITDGNLFNNPYSIPTIEPHPYNITVDNKGLNDYFGDIPSSGNIEIRTSFSGSLSLLTPINQYELPPDTILTVFLSSPSPSSSYLEVEGMVISPESTKASTTGWPEIVFDDIGFYPTSSYKYGNFAREESPKSGVSEYSPRPPYFLLSLPQPSTGSFSAGGDPDSGGLSWGTITGGGLSINKTGLNSKGERYFIFDHDSKDKKRPILGSPGFGWGTRSTHSISNGDFLFSSPTRIYNLYNKDNPNNNYPYSFYPSSGEIRLSTFPRTYYKSQSFEESVPIVLSINNMDNSNNNNKNVIRNNPQVTFGLSSSISYQDSYNIKSNILDSNHLPLYNIVEFGSLNYTSFLFSPSGRANHKIQDTNNSNVTFNPDYLGVLNFENTDYNLLLNNYNSNRPSTKYMKVDYSYDLYYPSNLLPIINNNAEKYPTPDSNYSSYKNLLSKYIGTKLQSLDYNNYTPKGLVQPINSLFSTQDLESSIAKSFLNGDKGSWEGDISYGKTSVIEKNPIYMAHFSSFKHNPVCWDTTEYTLDQFILLPNTPTGGKTLNPSSLQLRGSMKNIYEICSVFEPEREVEIYNETSGGFTPSLGGPGLIKNSGVYYQPIYSNQKSNVSSSLNWGFNIFNSISLTGSNSNSEPLLLTGSNYLQLRGASIPPFLFARANSPGRFDATGITGSVSLGGPYLGVLHTYNQLLANFYTEFTSSMDFNLKELFVSPSLNPLLPSDYFKWDPSASDLPEYRDEGVFLIKRGDEIRVSYDVPGSEDSGESNHTQIFTVTEVKDRQIPANSNDNTYIFKQGSVTSPSGSSAITPLFDRIYVTPDPETLINKIPKGEIKSFSIRRLVPSDNRLFLQPPPSDVGVLGNIALDTSKGGFLLPSDLSQTQKDNALNIINSLKAKNVFK